MSSFLSSCNPTGVQRGWVRCGSRVEMPAAGLWSGLGTWPRPQQGCWPCSRASARAGQAAGSARRTSPRAVTRSSPPPGTPRTPRPAALHFARPHWDAAPQLRGTQTRCPEVLPGHARPPPFADGTLAAEGPAAMGTMTSPGSQVPRPAPLTASARVNPVAGTRHPCLASPRKTATASGDHEPCLPIPPDPGCASPLTERSRMLEDTSTDRSVRLLLAKARKRKRTLHA